LKRVSVLLSAEMCSLVFPNNDSVMPGVLKMASGNVTVITRSPRSKKVTSSSKSKRHLLETGGDEENQNTSTATATTATTKAGKKKSKLTGTARRNERERNRVKQVNQGFARLRDHVPKRGRGRKMSKVDILRSAADYIQNLQSMLDESDAVSAVMNIAALSASLGENGQMLEDESDMASCSESGATTSHESGFPGSPTPSYDLAPSPGCLSMDGSSSSSSSSSASLSYEQHAPSYSPSSVCEQALSTYSPDEPTLMDLATWFH
jgi:hypothetical protein